MRCDVSFDGFWDSIAQIPTLGAPVADLARGNFDAGYIDDLPANFYVKQCHLLGNWLTNSICLKVYLWRGLPCQMLGLGEGKPPRRDQPVAQPADFDRAVPFGQCLESVGANNPVESIVRV